MHLGLSSREVAAYEIELQKRRRIADGTFTFVFERPDDFHFKAGQHVRMSLISPPESDAHGDQRFLTIASTPQDPDLAFAIRMRDTAFKRVLMGMRAGDRVRIEILRGESPHGSFVLHEDASRPAVFIVGGIGIVPAYSMIRDIVQRKLPHRIFLFDANRRAEDAPFLSELREISRQHPAFTMIATLTAPERSGGEWHGETGRIDRAMVSRYVDDPQSAIYYVAGLPGMVHAMQTMLAELGVDGNEVRAEEFAGFSTSHEETSPRAPWKRRLLVGGTVLGVVGMIGVHVLGGLAIIETRATQFTLAKPLVYLGLAAVAIAVALKFRHASRLLRRRTNRPA